MRKLNFVVAVAALAVTAMSLAKPDAANAYYRGCAVGAGVVTGIAAGAIIGSAIANSQAQAGPPGVAYVPSPPPPGAWRGGKSRAARACPRGKT